jgi:cysteine desulfurase / selenocysteine lyase
VPTHPPLDVAAARAATPGCASVAHLNNAGAALPPAAVTDAVVAHLRREATIGGYEAAEEAADALERPYDAVAELLGCHRDEVALVESATRAWGTAFAALAARLRTGDRVLTGRSEYASNVMALLQATRRAGAELVVVDDDAHGQVDVEAVAAHLDTGDVALVALTHVPTQGGLVNPAAEVGALTRAAGVPFLLDACQSVGQLATSVDELGCDALAATGRKFLRAPRGTGFLYVRRGLVAELEPALPDLRAADWTGPDRYALRPDARRFETWEHSAAGRIGLGVAVDHALGWGIDAIEARVVALAAGLRDRLAVVPGVTVHDRGVRRCGIVTFTVDGVDAAEAKAALRAAGINVHVSPAAGAQLDLVHRGVPDLVRASVHYYNAEDELDRLLTHLPRTRRG